MSGKPSAFVIASFVIACCARVSRMPLAGESVAAEATLVEPGGKGFNVALGLHRLGADVRGIVGVGSDLFAHAASSTLVEMGLGGIGIVRKSGPTGVGVGLSDPGGDNRVAIGLAANLLLAAEDLRGGIGEASLVVGQFEVGDGVLIAAFRDGRASGAETVLNPSPFRPIPADLLASTTILVMNESEADTLHGSLNAEPGEGAELHARLADALMRAGPHTVIITKGRAGVSAYRVSLPALHLPAFPADCVDPLGAGDAFTAGLCAALLDGRGFEDSLIRALACGAICVQTHGVLRGLPSAGELDAYLRGAGA